MTRSSSTPVHDAARLLRAGGLVAFPTETVYGLGADATSSHAVAGIFAVKGRPTFNPLIAHVATIDAAAEEGVLTSDAERLAGRFWPGPLTLVLARAPGGRVCDLACAGLSSVALRIPSHPLALDILREVGRPIAAPSANRSGRLSPTCAADVRNDLGDAIDLILDGGYCPIGLESTIVACLPGQVAMLRPGGLPRDAIEDIIGRPLGTPGAGIEAPGMLASHYAPNARLRLGATTISAGEVGLDFGGRLGRGCLDLSPRGDLAEAAANLYNFVRRLDATSPDQIAVACVPTTGLGEAINDRLRRAAVPNRTT